MLTNRMIIDYSSNMIFRPLEISDKALVQRYTLQSARRNCELSFANLYSWRFLYHTCIAETDGFLLVRFHAEGRLAYLMPVGEGDVRPVIERLMQDAAALGEPFQLQGVCVYMREKLEAAFPGLFDFTFDRDYFDYIYLRSDLATLRGKRFQAKRNHINRFKAVCPSYEYRALTPDLVAECLRLENLWCQANGCTEDQSLQEERCSMTAALQHIGELDIVGGVLHVEGRIVAFTYGAPINAVTFGTCVEKADTSVDGSYAMINHLFANHIPAHYIYINREEDLGLEGLRKSKLSYHPDTLLEKYTVTLK